MIARLYFRVADRYLIWEFLKCFYPAMQYLSSNRDRLLLGVTAL